MDAYIYTIINKKDLKEALSAFHACTELSVQVLDENGRILEQYGQTTDYCRCFISHIPASDSCQNIHASAGKRAMEIGESYIFSCHSNLNHIVFPLINKDQLFGSILIGPFLMEQPDSTLILDVGKHYPDFTTENLMDLYDATASLPVIEPSKATQISKLLYYTMSNLVSDSKEQFVINQKKLHQQARINESIQMYKMQEESEIPPYPFEKEQELLTKVKEGDLDTSSALLNDLLGYVFLAGGNSLDMVKYRALEICSLLSRASIETGANANQILNLNNEFLKNLSSYKSIDDLCYALIEILSAFIDCAFPSIVEGTRIMREAMSYISSHFQEKLTLTDLAEHLHLTPAYFSRLFKQGSGQTFKEYLTHVRIEESKHLLKNTSYPLIDIALSVGFDNQSYFTRVFRKATGLTPKQYRD